MKELNQIKEVSNYFILFISIFILLVIIQISNCVKNLWIIFLGPYYLT